MECVPTIYAHADLKSYDDVRHIPSLNHSVGLRSIVGADCGISWFVRAERAGGGNDYTEGCRKPTLPAVLHDMGCL